ncbi:protein NRT1/ PTR FAMILY 1.2 [Cajanus cajan]|uniref:Peptide transporter At1g52190 family n=1 Tax=Cajanus cajan TaxID=3821 RepID=A0A151SGW4_CAJCA|nr:protein NRT1/ PTR FAMILY 1.2 [Cajanus cajan]KYP54072.1 putative peptide transporter At1g52190 family [Cajanus cajan]
MDSSGATNQKLLENGDVSSSSSSQPTKGGLRTMPFIIVNECLEKVASFGIMASMILYLTEEYGMGISKGTNVIYTSNAMSNFLAIFGAFISDSYLGRFLVISLGSFSSLLGLIILWLTAMIPELRPSCESLMEVCNSATTAQLAVLFLSLGLISIGAGCIRPCSIAFGADQLTIKERSNDERLLDSYFNWYYTSVGVSTVIAFSVIVYIQENLGWKIGFGVVAVLMFISAVSFILGSPFYAKVKPRRSILASFVQVIVVAVKNRKLSLPDCNLDHYFQDRDSDLMVPTDTLRYLNKACIIRTHETVSNPDGSVSDPWSQCTVGQVESLKSLLKVLPMWSAGIFGMVPQGSFSTLQANTMDRRLFGNFKIPAGSFTLITVITLSIIIPFYDRIMVPLLSKYTGSPRGFSCKSRIGMGMLFVCAAMATSAAVETMRRNASIEEGFEDQPNAVIPMSALWLVPQFVMLGIAEALNPVGQIEFFYTYIPKSMSSFASALFTLELAAANVVGSVLLNIVDKVTSVGGKVSWLSTNINRGHLNYYYALLGCICLINYLYFLVICWAYGPAPRQKLQASAGKKEEQFDYRELPTS